MAPIKVILLEPDDVLGSEIVRYLSGAGIFVKWARNLNRYMKILLQENFDVLIVDDVVRGDSLLEIVQNAKTTNSFCIVIILTDPEEMEITINAMETGADGYIKKPLDKRELTISINRLLQNRGISSANLYLRRTQDLIYRYDEILSYSPSLKGILSVVKRVAMSNATVLIQGETGTGKELIAGAIHYNSPRRGNNFIKVNCSALQDTLLESELFGHEKGAFTGADRQRIGRFEQANFGTIFLDEVADMSPSAQAKILRVLEEKEFERVGGTRTIEVDVRIISATNKDLKEEIRKKRFREDLYYRLNVVTIDLPPLRERRGDIIPLSYYFLRRFSGELGKKVTGFSPSAEKKLKEYLWPGNVRELRNTIERALLLCEEEFIQVDDILLSHNGEVESLSGLKEHERQLILRALERANWVQKVAASYLGISARVLNYKIRKYGIRNPSWLKNR